MTRALNAALSMTPSPQNPVDYTPFDLALWEANVASTRQALINVEPAEWMRFDPPKQEDWKW